MNPVSALPSRHEPSSAADRASDGALFEHSPGPAPGQRIAFVSVHYNFEYLGRSLQSAIQLARELNAREFIAIANGVADAGMQFFGQVFEHVAPLVLLMPTSA